ncbi:MAG: restriction endonuclease subunit S [Pirellulaceae bacterium]|nr:restriction endonuclease subunit S [Pirellulaceae bacterium]
MIAAPPFPEQRRIAGILQEQLSAVERARAAAQAQLEAAQALPAAYLREVFDSTDLDQVGRRTIGDLCQLLPSKSIATAGDAEVQAITTACLTERGFDPLGIKAARMWSNDAALCRVAPNEVLIARSNTSELVGRVAMFPGEPAGAVASDLTIRIWAGHRIDPRFLATYLSYLYVTRFWREKAGGASDSMKKITRSQISSLSIPLPELGEQRSIVEGLEVKQQLVGNLERASREQLRSIDRMPAALLRAAFRGEL